MALLVVVFLIPWLEAGGRLHRGQGLTGLRIHSPWTLFYGLLALAGVTNYLPTRYGPAACAIGLGLVLEYLGLTRSDWSDLTRSQIWMGVGWSLAFAGWAASLRARGPSAGRNNLERLWLWFRDHWGVVWALRIEERFNRSAEVGRWPIRLGWFGLVPTGETTTEHLNDLPAAEATFRSLIRRFVTPERVDALISRIETQSCQPQPPAR